MSLREKIIKCIKKEKKTIREISRETRADFDEVHDVIIELLKEGKVEGWGGLLFSLRE